MKKFGLLIILCSTLSFAQPWNYDFGNNSSSSFITSNTISTAFLPTSPSGTAMVRVSNGQGGGFYLDKPWSIFAWY